MNRAKPLVSRMLGRLKTAGTGVVTDARDRLVSESDRVARDRARTQKSPDGWLEGRDPPLASDARVVVVVHVFYPELVSEIICRLEAIPVPFDLLVTDATGAGVSAAVNQLGYLRSRAFLKVENRGRDLWPLARLVNAGLLDTYDLVLKVHTKRSDWRADHPQLVGTGRSWRSGLLSAVLGGPHDVARILDAFATSPDLGIVTGDGSVLGPDYWGSNEGTAAALLRRLDADLQPDALVFPAGSMYWSRASIIRDLARLRLTAADFEAERGQIDGTTAHALERIIGVLATRAGLHIVESADLDAWVQQSAGWNVG